MAKEEENESRVHDVYEPRVKRHELEAVAHREDGLRWVRRVALWSLLEGTHLVSLRHTSKLDLCAHVTHVHEVRMAMLQDAAARAPQM